MREEFMMELNDEELSAVVGGKKKPKKKDSGNKKPHGGSPTATLTQGASALSTGTGSAVATNFGLATILELPAL